MTANRKRIGIIGAGAIGFNLASMLGEKGYDVSLYNRKQTDSVRQDPHWLEKEGRVDDINDALSFPHCGYVTLTSNIETLAGCYALVITAGATRKEGESRQDLISKNASIINHFAPLIAASPDMMVLVISNPVDTLAHLLIDAVASHSGKSKDVISKKIAGVSYVDTMRLTNLTREVLAKRLPDIQEATIQALVIGEHGSTMTPLFSQLQINGNPATTIITQEECDTIMNRVIYRGSDIIHRTGTSAFTAPARAVLFMIDQMARNEPCKIPCSVYDGKRCIGKLANFHGNNITGITELTLPEGERSMLARSEAALDGLYLLLSERPDSLGGK